MSFMICSVGLVNGDDTSDYGCLEKLLLAAASWSQCSDMKGSKSPRGPGLNSRHVPPRDGSGSM